LLVKESGSVIISQLWKISGLGISAYAPIMNREEIITRINAFLAEDFEVDPESLQPEASLKETLDLDSLDYIDLVVAIEHQFGFKVNPEDFQNMVTMTDFYNYVELRLAAQAA